MYVSKISLTASQSHFDSVIKSFCKGNKTSTGQDRYSSGPLKSIPGLEQGFVDNCELLRVDDSTFDEQKLSIYDKKTALSVLRYVL